MSTVTTRLVSTPLSPTLPKLAGLMEQVTPSLALFGAQEGARPGSQERSTRCPGLYFSRKSPPRRSNPREKCSMYKDVLTASFITVRTEQKNSWELTKATGSESGHCHRKYNMLVKMTRMCHDVTSYANSHETTRRLANV